MTNIGTLKTSFGILKGFCLQESTSWISLFGEIHKIFWRTYIFLREEFDHAPKYKEIWQAIYDDVENSDMEDSLAVRREFDPNEIIEKIDSIGMPKTTKLFWIDATAGGEISSQGNYSLSSLPSLINKLKKDPPKI